MEKNSLMDKNKPAEKSRLGRGLSALIPPAPRPAPAAVPSAPERTATAPTPAAPAPAPPDKAEQVQEIPIAAIVPNSFQPRTQFDPAALDDLTESIKAHGVLQPILVRPTGKNRYELIAGERRFRAAERAGLSRIPVIVREITDEESLTVALIENIQRENLNAIETARGYRQLLDQFRVSQTELARALGKGLSTISNALRLLDLPSEVQDSVAHGKLSAEHGKILLSVASREQQLALWRKVVDEELSTKATQDIVNREGLASSPKTRAASHAKDIHWQSLEDQFRTTLGMKIELKPGRSGQGTLMIEFSSNDEIEDFLSRLNSV